MPIIKTKHTEKYSIIDNNILNNKSLSLKAKGLLCYALSRPDSWRFSKRGIMCYCKDKESSIETALKELEEHFYLKREEIRDKGKFNTVYTFYEIPFEIKNANNEKAIRLKTRGRSVVRQIRSQLNNEYIK